MFGTYKATIGAERSEAFQAVATGCIITVETTFSVALLTLIPDTGIANWIGASAVVFLDKIAK